jgi:hypothetical protein
MTTGFLFAILLPSFVVQIQNRLLTIPYFFQLESLRTSLLIALCLHMIELCTVVELAIAALDALHPEIKCTIAKSTKNTLCLLDQ